MRKQSAAVIILAFLLIPAAFGAAADIRPGLTTVIRPK
jgi:hypothetical protein